MAGLVITRKSDSITQIVRRTRIYLYAALFFLALGTIDLAAAFGAVHPGDLVAPGLGSLFAGVLFAFTPHAVTIEIDRRAGELRRSSHALFRRRESSDALAELDAIELDVQTYVYWYFARRKDGDRLPLFAETKRTWTFTRVPEADTLARAREVADAFGLPLAPQQPSG